MRLFLRFFFSPSPPAAPDAAFDVFFAALAPPSAVVFAGAFEAVDAGALPAVEAGLGAIAIDVGGGEGGEFEEMRSDRRARRDERAAKADTPYL